MLSRKVIAGLGALAALGLLIHLVLDARRKNREAQQEMLELREAMTELRRAVGRADRLDAVGALGRAQVVPSRTADERERTDADRGELEEGAGEAAAGERGAQVLSVDERMQRAEAELATEAVDVAWAGEASLSVERTLGRIVPAGSSVQSLQCRTTRCRLELKMRDEASLESFQREALYGEDLLWRGPMMMTRAAQPDGSITTVAHLVR